MGGIEVVVGGLFSFGGYLGVVVGVGSILG